MKRKYDWPWHLSQARDVEFDFFFLKSINTRMTSNSRSQYIKLSLFCIHAMIYLKKKKKFHLGLNIIIIEKVLNHLEMWKISFSWWLWPNSQGQRPLIATEIRLLSTKIMHTQEHYFPFGVIRSSRLKHMYVTQSLQGQWSMVFLCWVIWIQKHRR